MKNTPTPFSLLSLSSVTLGLFASPLLHAQEPPINDQHVTTNQQAHVPASRINANRFMIKLRLSEQPNQAEFKRTLDALNQQFLKHGLQIQQIYGQTARASADALPLKSVSGSSQSISQIFSVSVLNANLTVNQAIEIALSTGLVEFAEPVYQSETKRLPNDAQLKKEQWYLNNPDPANPKKTASNGYDIRANQAWDVGTGNGNVVVAVVDMGVLSTHEDLAANMWVNPNEVVNNGVDDDGDGVVDNLHGVNASDPNVLTGNTNPEPTTTRIEASGSATSADTHGSMVAGLIAAVGNNRKGISGVSWRSKIMSIRIGQHSQIANDAIISGLNFVREKKLAGVNIKVVNLSTGFYGYSAAYREAIKSLGDLGVLVVVAAGNNNFDSSYRHFYPSAFDLPNMIVVGATDKTGRVAGFSNFGADVDIMAPGVDITSTADGGYASDQGTSFAAPIVAGAAALLWETEPNLTVAQVKNRLLARASDSISNSPPLSDTARTNRHLNLARTMSPEQCLAPEPVMMRPLKTIEPWVQGASHLVEVLIEPCSDTQNVQFSLGQQHITLKDDGIYPDSMANDGIFSQVFTPNQAGFFEATATHNRATNAHTKQLKTLEVVPSGNYAASPSTLKFTRIATLAPSARALPLSNFHNGIGGVNTPFAVSFYGKKWNRFFVSTSGRICFQTALECLDYPAHEAIPSGRKNVASLGFIAPWWNDWRESNLGEQGKQPAGIYTHVAGAAPNRRLYISWEGMRDSGDVTKTNAGASFQVVFHENQPDFDIAYASLNSGGTSSNLARGTVGTQFYNGNIGTEQSFNQAGVIKPNSAYKWAFRNSFSDIQKWKTDIEGLQGVGLAHDCAAKKSPVLASAQKSFCPKSSLTRGEMAVLLLQSMEGNRYKPPAAQGNVFADTPKNDAIAPYIEDLQRKGVIVRRATNGVRKFYAQNKMTRDVLAAWLVKVLKGSDYVPAPATGVFQDVQKNNPQAAYVEELHRMGLSNGCPQPSSIKGMYFCPQEVVSKGTAAVWMQRAFRFYDYR